MKSTCRQVRRFTIIQINRSIEFSFVGSGVCKNCLRFMIPWGIVSKCFHIWQYESDEASGCLSSLRTDSQLFTSSPPQRKEDIRLINATLDVYKRVFSSILHHQQQQHGGEAAASGLLDKLSSSNRTRVQAHLEKLQNKMEELRGRLSRMNQDRRDEQDMLSKLKNIKVSDTLIFTSTDFTVRFSKVTVKKKETHERRKKSNENRIL